MASSASYLSSNSIKPELYGQLQTRPKPGTDNWTTQGFLDFSGPLGPWNPGDRTISYFSLTQMNPYRISISMKCPKSFHILWKNLRHHQFGHDPKFRQYRQNIRIYPSRSKRSLFSFSILKFLCLKNEQIFSLGSVASGFIQKRTPPAKSLSETKTRRLSEFS